MPNLVFATKKVAEYEKNRRTYPHRIVKVEKHFSDCLFSDGSILATYGCTCGGTGETFYSLILGD